jgi:hypothetical protein
MMDKYLYKYKCIRINRETVTQVKALRLFADGLENYK